MARLALGLLGTLLGMTLTLMIVLNVVLDVALLAGLALALAHPRKLTPHQPGVTGNAWRLRRPLRQQQTSRSRGERAPRLSPVLD